MGSSLLEAVQVQDFSCAYDAKVHGLMCKELKSFVDRILQIFPAIELARPGCMYGIQALCSLNRAIEKAKLLLQHCAESSKLYLAVTAESITSRCERIWNSLDQSLSQLQNMVPQSLAIQISEIVNDLKGAKFIIESSEKEAGRVVLALLQQNKSASALTEPLEFEAFQTAANMLNIISPKALLIEKRSLKKLLDKVRDSDPRKESIVTYLLHLLQKYGKQVRNVDDQCKCPLSSTNSACRSQLCEINKKLIQPNLLSEFGCDECQTDISGTHEPPEEFKCPISLKIMYDPIVIASGQTYERIWIEKWFSDGHNTCPKTQKKLPHLSMTPNSCVKDLISNWCRKHGITIPNPCSQPIPAAFCSWSTSYSSSSSSFSSSINSGPPLQSNTKPVDYIDQSDTSNTSVGSSDTSFCSAFSCTKSNCSLKDWQSQLFSWNDDTLRSQSSTNCAHETYLGFLTKLASLQLESQRKMVNDFKNLLKERDGACNYMLSNGFVEALSSFLKDACRLSDTNALKIGAQVLLAFVSTSRTKVPFLSEDVFLLFVSSLDSGLAKEALEIMQVLSSNGCHKSKMVALGAVPSIIKILDSLVGDSLAHAVKILYDLSSLSGVGFQMLSSDCISRLVPLLSDSKLAGNIVKILRNLNYTEGCRAQIAEANGCIASIVQLLETGSLEDQEHAAAILLSLCSDSFDYCQLVMKEGVIPFLVSVSVNGNRSGRESAMRLLQLLRDVRENVSSDSSLSQVGSDSEVPQDLENFCLEKRPASKTSSFFKRKLGIFSKPRSISLFLVRRVAKST